MDNLISDYLGEHIRIDGGEFTEIPLGTLDRQGRIVRPKPDAPDESVQKSTTPGGHGL